MHMHLNFAFKWALNFSPLVIKLFNCGTKLFQAIIITTPLRTSLLLNAHPCDTPFFKTNALRHVMLLMKSG